MHERRLFSLILACFLVGPLSACGQDAEVGEEIQLEFLAEEATSLLETAPLQAPGEDATDEELRQWILDQGKFILETEALYAEAQGVGDLEERSVESVEEAVVALGEVAAILGRATVVVASVPPGVPVKYHDLLQDVSDLNRTVITDDSLVVDPMWYYFWAVDPATGDTTRALFDCVRGCTVRFDFTGESDDDGNQ